MAKPNEQAQIDFIVECLRKGEQRKVILAKFEKEWQNASTTTFDRRLGAAKKALESEREQINEKLKENIDKVAESFKDKILSHLELQEFLSDIVKSKTDIKIIGRNAMPVLIKDDGTKEIISLSDKIAAARELAKIAGYNAPTKNEIITDVAPVINVMPRSNNNADKP